MRIDLQHGLNRRHGSAAIAAAGAESAVAGEVQSRINNLRTWYYNELAKLLMLFAVSVHVFI